MKQVAKLIIIDKNNRYLLMCRNNHPAFGNDPDLPGGTIEGNEEPARAMLREVNEETGIKLKASAVKQIYKSTEYADGFIYYLFIAKLGKRPVVSISWEHSSYAWINRDDFLDKTKGARDTYMHMAHDAMQNFIT